MRSIVRQAQPLRLQESKLLRAHGSTLTRPSQKDEAIPPTGQLADYEVVDLLRTLRQRRSTGILTLTSPRSGKRSIYILDGDIVATSTSSEDQRLGRFFFRAGIINRAQLEEALRATTHEHHLGEVLVEKKFITPEQRQTGLAAQFKEILFSSFLLKEGTFSFTPQETIFADNLQLFFDSDDLIREGQRLSEETAQLAAALDREDHIYQRVGVQPSMPLGQDEKKILRLMDGRRPTSKIFVLSPIERLPTIRILAQLLERELIRKIATAPRQSPEEIPTYPLLPEEYHAAPPSASGMEPDGRPGERIDYYPGHASGESIVEAAAPEVVGMEAPEADEEDLEAGLFMSDQLDKVDLSHVRQYGVAADIPLDGIVEVGGAEEEHEDYVLDAEEAGHDHIRTTIKIGIVAPREAESAEAEEGVCLEMGDADAGEDEGTAESIVAAANAGQGEGAITTLETEGVEGDGTMAVLEADAAEEGWEEDEPPFHGAPDEYERADSMETGTRDAVEEHGAQDEEVQDETVRIEGIGLGMKSMSAEVSPIVHEPPPIREDAREKAGSTPASGSEAIEQGIDPHPISDQGVGEGKTITGEERAILDEITKILRPAIERNGDTASGRRDPSIPHQVPGIKERIEIYNLVFAHVFRHYAKSLGVDETERLFRSSLSAAHSSHPELFKGQRFTQGHLDTARLGRALEAHPTARPHDLLDAALNEVFHTLLKGVDDILDPEARRAMMDEVIEARGRLFRRAD